MEKAFPRGNLNCHILKTESRRKLKFCEVSLQICQKFLRKKNKQNIFDLKALLRKIDAVSPFFASALLYLGYLLLFVKAESYVSSFQSENKLSILIIRITRHVFIATIIASVLRSEKKCV